MLRGTQWVPSCAAAAGGAEALQGFGARARISRETLLL